MSEQVSHFAELQPFLDILPKRLSIGPNRILTRPPVAKWLQMSGYNYDFFEDQEESTGLFPLEIKKCKEVWDTCSYLPDKERILILPALAYALSGHQTQWRKSGVPYFVHLTDSAIEATSKYKVYWWEICNILLHGILEETPRYGYEVNPSEISATYTNLGYPQEGNIMARSILALTKIEEETPWEQIKHKVGVIFGRRPIPAAIRTVMRHYDSVLEIEEYGYGGESVVLSKLIERKNNMETLRFIRPESRIQMADDTLRNKVPMAEAFHLHTLRDELAELSIAELYPEEFIELKYTHKKIAMKYDTLIKDLFIKRVSAELQSFGPISRWSDKNPPMITLRVPSLYDLFKAKRKEKDSYLHLQLQVLLPEIFEEETDGEWNDRAFECYQILVHPNLAQSIPRPVDIAHVVQETTRIPGKFLHFTTRVQDIDFRTTILSSKQRILDHASLLDLITFKDAPDIGYVEEWRDAAYNNLQNVRERYRHARKRGNLEAFFNVISGEKRIMDEVGNAQQFPEEATILDVLQVLYGDDAFYVDSVRIRNVNGYEVKVSGNGLYQVISEGVQIVGIRKQRNETIRPVWLDNTSIEGG